MPDPMPGEFWAAAEWLFNRYQTLLVGLLAVAIGFRQVGVSRKQNEIVERQTVIMENQARQAAATATLAIDRVIVPLFKIMGLMAANHPHHPVPDTEGESSWQPSVLTEFTQRPVDWSQDAMDAAAVVAFPEQAGDISQMLLAARELQGLAAEYEKAPWQPEMFEHDSRNGQLDAAIANFIKFGHRIGQIQPHARAAVPATPA